MNRSNQKDIMKNYLVAENKIQRTVPATLYHYCSLDNLHFLLEPGADMMFRYLSCQGDKEEYRFGALILCDYIRNKGGRYIEAGDVIEANLVGNIGCIGELSIKPMIPLTFSLTERIDSDYHYQQYGKGNGCAIAFNQVRLDQCCDKLIKAGRSIRLIKCYYVGVSSDSQKIKELCDAFWEDQKGNIDYLIETEYCDALAGLSIVTEICTIAPHFKRKKFEPDNEWRLVLVSPDNTGVDKKGFKASGLREMTVAGDIIDIMEGVALQRTIFQDRALHEVSLFGVQLRNRDFKVWV